MSWGWGKLDDYLVEVREEHVKGKKKKRTGRNRGGKERVAGFEKGRKNEAVVRGKGEQRISKTKATGRRNGDRKRF